MKLIAESGAPARIISARLSNSFNDKLDSFCHDHSAPDLIIVLVDQTFFCRVRHFFMLHTNAK